MKTRVMKSLTDLRNEQLNKVQEKGFKRLNDLFDSLWEEAQGVRFLVTPTNRKNALPKSADKEGTGHVIDHVCPKCKQPVLKEPIEVFEVWKQRRDAGLLKYLFDQWAGKSAQKEKDVVDPEIIIVFDSIDSGPPPDQRPELFAEKLTQETPTSAQPADEPLSEFGLP